MDFPGRLEKAEGFAEIFGLVKEAVTNTLNRERSGLMLGLSGMGIGHQGFIGGFHQLGSNTIVLNKSVLERLGEKKPVLLKPYIFSTLLHEYLHSLGIVDEHRARILTYKICSDTLGEDHTATKLSMDVNKLAVLVAENGPEASSEFQDFAVVEGFDMESMSYIG
jgi:hypothetical protein